jgi:hypothetical protein
MNTGPYSEENVKSYLESEFIPLKSQCFWEQRTELMKRFEVAWTPTLLVLDATGKEHHRVVGFVPTDDFLAHLKLGKGKHYFDRFRFDVAGEAFREVIEQHPSSGSVPEAIFFQGVAGYWKTHDPKALRQAFDTLSAKHNQSEWARRARPYEQIPL